MLLFKNQGYHKLSRQRLMTMITNSISSDTDIDIERCHQQAITRNQNAYIDPITRYQVFTSNFLLQRGWCCASSCRHCPYGHYNVLKKDATATTTITKMNIIKDSILLRHNHRSNKRSNNNDVECFFLGQQDNNYMNTFDIYRNNNNDNRYIILVAFFNGDTGIIRGNNNYHTIMKEAISREVDLLLIPIHNNNIDDNINNHLCKITTNTSHITLVFDTNDHNTKRLLQQKYYSYTCLFPFVD